ncbi:VOC family protein [Falsibacillus albus]|uniref:VOC family protein n=1 Tax=Falsibacillus albus TaxID=2478915 RepID=A0A3L7JQG4_9BACI|nr:VOC family protein [Falsibacillus albus]RLQ92299.1 VOC family protein [Falsibacillus albus]
MKSPIINQMNTVFVHVSNLKESVRWYSNLLGQDHDLASVKDPVYNIQINHHTGLTLDAGPEGIVKQPTAHDQPLFNFHTADIEEAYAYTKELGYHIHSNIVRYDDFSFFTIKDPDGNVIMICTG